MTARVGIGTNHGDHEVGVDAVGDEGLGAVDDVFVAVTDRSSRDRGEVGASARFGHRDRGDQLAGCQARKPAITLVVVAQLGEVGSEDVVHEGHAVAGATHAGVLELFIDDRVEPEVVGPAAAV